MAIDPGKHLLLTGKPGCGKTTVIRRAIADTKDAGGFFTGETREHGKRTGFTITTLDGREGILAGTDVLSPVHVGRYGVNIRDVDEVAASSLEMAIIDRDIHLVVIDEIASMELASDRFKDAVVRAMDSGKPVLGTIQLRAGPFLDDIRGRPDVAVIEVDRDNRGRLPGEIAEWIGEAT